MRVVPLDADHPLRVRDPSVRGNGAIFDFDECGDTLVGRQHPMLNVAYLDPLSVIGYPYGGVLRCTARSTDYRDLREIFQTGSCERMRVAYGWTVYHCDDAEVCDCTDACCGQHFRDHAVVEPQVENVGCDNARRNEELQKWAAFCVDDPSAMAKLRTHGTRNNVVIGVAASATLSREERFWTPEVSVIDQAWDIDAVGAMNELAMVNDPTGYGQHLGQEAVEDPNPNLIVVHARVFNVPFVFYMTRRTVVQSEEALVSYGPDFFGTLETTRKHLNFVEEACRGHGRRRADVEKKINAAKAREEKLKKELRTAAAARNVLASENESLESLLQRATAERGADRALIMDLKKRADEVGRVSAEKAKLSDELNAMEENQKLFIATLETTNNVYKSTVEQLARERLQSAFGQAQMVNATRCPYSVAANLYGNGSIHIIGNDVDVHYRSKCQYVRLFKQYVEVCPECDVRFLAGSQQRHRELECRGRQAQHIEAFNDKIVAASVDREESVVRVDALSRLDPARRVANMKKVSNPLTFFFLKSLVLSVLGATCLDASGNLCPQELEAIGVDRVCVDFTDSLESVCSLIHTTRDSLLKHFLPDQLLWVLDFSTFVTEFGQRVSDPDSALTEFVAQCAEAHDRIEAMLYCEDHQASNLLCFNVAAHAMQPLVEIQFRPVEESLRFVTEQRAQRMRETPMPGGHGRPGPNSLKVQVQQHLSQLRSAFVTSATKKRRADAEVAPEPKRQRVEAEDEVKVEPVAPVAGKENLVFSLSVVGEGDDRTVRGEFAQEGSEVTSRRKPTIFSNQGTQTIIMAGKDMGLHLRPPPRFTADFRLELRFFARLPSVHDYYVKVHKKENIKLFTVVFPLVTAKTQRGRCVPFLSLVGSNKPTNPKICHDWYFAVGGESLLRAHEAPTLPWNFCDLPHDKLLTLTLTSAASSSQIHCTLTGSDASNARLDPWILDAGLSSVGYPDAPGQESEILRGHPRRKAVLAPNSAFLVVQARLFHREV